MVHLSSAAALDEVRRAKAAGVRVTAETCPHYLTLTDGEYEEPDPTRCACYVISPPLRSAADRDALWVGLTDGSLDLVATDHVPDRVGIEKAEAAKGISFDRISNGAPGIETLLALVHSEGVAREHLTLERMVDLLSTTPAARFGLTRKGSIEVGRDADIVVFDQSATRTLRATDLHHTSDYTPYEGFAVSGTVRDVLVRGADVIRDVPSSAAAAPDSSSNEAPSQAQRPDQRPAPSITAMHKSSSRNDSFQMHVGGITVVAAFGSVQPLVTRNGLDGCGASESSPPMAATSFAQSGRANARELTGLQATDGRLRESGGSR